MVVVCSLKTSKKKSMSHNFHLQRTHNQNFINKINVRCDQIEFATTLLAICQQNVRQDFINNNKIITMLLIFHNSSLGVSHDNSFHRNYDLNNIICKQYIHNEFPTF